MRRRSSAFLDQQKQTNAARARACRAIASAGRSRFTPAAVRSDRIRAVAPSTAAAWSPRTPNSPHLLIPKTKASFVVAIARNDDQKQPDAKDVLKATFAAAKRPAIVEVYPADHGWCVPGARLTTSRRPNGPGPSC